MDPLLKCSPHPTAVDLTIQTYSWQSVFPLLYGYGNTNNLSSRSQAINNCSLNCVSDKVLPGNPSIITIYVILSGIGMNISSSVQYIRTYFSKDIYHQRKLSQRISLRAGPQHGELLYHCRHGHPSLLAPSLFARTYVSTS